MDVALVVSMFSWFVGSFVCGLCSIGVALVAVPFMLLVMPAQTAVLVSCLTAIGLSVGMAVTYRRDCRRKTELGLLVGAMPGAFIGLHMLKTFPGATLEFMVGCMLVFFVLGLQLFQDRLHLEERWPYAMVAGFAGGLFGTCICIDGPFIALYGLLVRWKPKEFLGITSIFFLCRNVFSAILQAHAGLFTEQIVVYALWSIPASLAGFFLSVPLVKRVNVDLFRKGVQAILLVAGTVCLVKHIG